jgi:hypothetical protein
MDKCSQAANSHLSDTRYSNVSRRRTESPWISRSNNDLFPPLEVNELSQCVLPSKLLIDRKPALARAISLPSISDHVTSRSKQLSLSSATDNSFYPMHLQRAPREWRTQAPDASKLKVECDLGLSMSTPPRRGPLDWAFPYYDSKNNAAVWDGAGWGSMQHDTQTNAALGVTVGGIPPPRSSLVGEWNVINLGGG